MRGRGREREREGESVRLIMHTFIRVRPSADSILGRRTQVFVELIAGPEERAALQGGISALFYSPILAIIRLPHPVDRFRTCIRSGRGKGNLRSFFRSIPPNV